jgi:glycosyltransferase involved in cell wall biosynthesis
MSAAILIASLMRPQGETGVQTHVRAVRDWLEQNGRSVKLVTPFDCPHWLVYPVFGLRRLLDRMNKVASVWWYRHWHAAFLQRALQKRLAAGQACVVYAQCPLSARAALRARASSAQKVVMVVHFNLSQADEWADKGAIPRDGAFFRSIRSLEERVLPGLDGLVFVSDFMRRELQQRIPAVGRVRSEVIPNFLDDPGEPVFSDERSDLITLGTLEYRKNQRYALEIVHAAARLSRVITLTVVGDGPDRAMLETLAHELRIEKQVRFCGFVSHAATLMPSHRACLHVAHMENLPLTLIEALSRGLPVFAPAAGGMPEVFEDGVQGRLIPLDDPQAAAHLILEWLDDEAVMRRVQSAARRRFLDCFEADRVASELAGFLDEVASA